jgi:hypothetical protein
MEHRLKSLVTPALSVLAACVILPLACQCGNPKQSGSHDPMQFPDWTQIQGSKALFLVPESVQRPLYLIHDPLLGSEIPMEDGWKVYRFDDTGVLRVRWFEEMRLPNYWLRASTYQGQELEASKSAFESGGRQYLAISTWDLMEIGQSLFFEYPNWLEPLPVQLSLRGFRDLEVTPDHQVLITADPYFAPREGSRVDNAPLPQFPSNSHPTPRFVVPDGYSGPIYLITDPRRGSPPRRQGDEDVYVFPEDGILRVQLTEDQSRNLAWPLVFERRGQKLWLRAIRSPNAGFKHLPISAFLVCRSETDSPNFQGRDIKTPYEHLVARGVPDLHWE